MAQYIAAARTNYVKVENLDCLKQALADWPISIHESSEEGYYCFLSDESDSGGWPSHRYDEDDREIEFSWEDVVMPFIAVDEVLVAKEVGYEKLRFLVGFAEAYVRRADGTVGYTNVGIGDIYDKARARFGVESITTATY